MNAKSLAKRGVSKPTVAVPPKQSTSTCVEYYLQKQTELPPISKAQKINPKIKKHSSFSCAQDFMNAIKLRPVSRGLRCSIKKQPPAFKH